MAGGDVPVRSVGPAAKMLMCNCLWGLLTPVCGVVLEQLKRVLSALSPDRLALARNGLQLLVASLAVLRIGGNSRMQTPLHTGWWHTHAGGLLQKLCVAFARAVRATNKESMLPDHAAKPPRQLICISPRTLGRTVSLCIMHVGYLAAVPFRRRI